MVTNIKVYLLSDYWAAGTAQLKISFRRLRQRGKRDLTKLRRRRRRQRQWQRQRAIGLISQKAHFARALRFLVHFLAVPARLQREMTKF